jgi:hypothetical protein
MQLELRDPVSGEVLVREVLRGIGAPRLSKLSGLNRVSVWRFLYREATPSTRHFSTYNRLLSRTQARGCGRKESGHRGMNPIVCSPISGSASTPGVREAKVRAMSRRSPPDG